LLSSENQFVYPKSVGGSKLIFFAPFRVGVNEENQFDPLGKEYDYHKINMNIC
jgi:hypothetical protein